MTRDIAELDERAQYLRVMWRKAHNYHASLARAFSETKALIESAAFGPEWTASKWLLTKVGLSEPQLMKMILVYRKAIDQGQREKFLADQAERGRQRRVAAAEKRAANAAQKAARKERSAAKNADDEDKLIARLQAQFVRKQKQDIKRQRDAEHKREQRKQQKAAAAADVDHILLERLAKEILIAKTQAYDNRSAWIAAALRQAGALAFARAQFHSNQAFGKWLIAHAIDYPKDQRAALIYIGQHIDIAKPILENTNSWSYREIWLKEIRPQIPPSRLRGIAKTEFPAFVFESDEPRESIH
jgi:hypothetical protein